MLLLILDICFKTGICNGSRQRVGRNFAGFDLDNGFIRQRNIRIGDARDFRKYSLHFRNAGTSRHV